MSARCLPNPAIDVVGRGLRTLVRVAAGVAAFACSRLEAQSGPPPLSGVTGVGVSRELAESRAARLAELRYALA